MTLWEERKKKNQNRKTCKKGRGGISGPTAKEASWVRTIDLGFAIGLVHLPARTHRRAHPEDLGRGRGEREESPGRREKGIFAARGKRLAPLSSRSGSNLVAPNDYSIKRDLVVTCPMICPAIDVCLPAESDGDV